MKTTLLSLALLVIINLQAFSQIVFEKGYFIDEADQKTECLIQNIDWKNNPTGFEYKLSENDATQKATIERVKEFGINGISKYLRATVNIDRSDNRTGNLKSERNPSFAEERLFLKAIVEGKASLYSYVDGNLLRFFFRIDISPISQLVYKRYMVDQNILENNFYKQQLALELKCDKQNDVNNLRYEKNELRRFIQKYNECVNAEYINYGTAKQNKDVFNLSVRPGATLSTLQIDHHAPRHYEYDFGTILNYRLGVEAELILPFNKDKWSLFIEPTYQHLTLEKEFEQDNVLGGVVISKFLYRTVEIPVGVRHYFFLNSNSKIFVNASYLFNIPLNSSAKFKRKDGSLRESINIAPRNRFALGMGYKYKDRYGIELRYHTNQELLNDQATWTSQYKTLSFVVGYSLF